MQTNKASRGKKLNFSAVKTNRITYNDIKINIFIENVKVTVILDTGSQTNLISKNTLNAITKNWEPLKDIEPRYGIGVGGEPFKFIITRLNVTLGNITKPSLFAVTDLKRDDILLGLPFLVAFGISIKMSPDQVIVTQNSENVEIVSEIKNNDIFAYNVKRFRVRRKQFKFIEIKFEQKLTGEFLIEELTNGGGVTQLVSLNDEDNCKIGVYNNSKKSMYFGKQKAEFKLTKFIKSENEIRSLDSLTETPDTLLSYLDRCSIRTIDGTTAGPYNIYQVNKNNITKVNATDCVEGDLLPPEVVDEILNHLPGTDFKFKGSELPIEEIIERDLNKKLPTKYRNFIKNLLLKYPKLVPRYSLDAGVFSDHKGDPLYLKFPLKYEITKNTKPYFLNAIDKNRLRDILDFLLFFGLAAECSEYEQFGSPVFLNQANPLRPPRLIVDVRGINSCIDCPVSTPPDCLIEVIQKIGNDNIISCVDLKNAYYSILNSPEAIAKGLSNMITPWGAFKLFRAPTGCSQLPVFWRTNLVRQLSKNDRGYHKPLSNLTIWYDDLILGSPDEAAHFEMIKKLFHRLNRSGLKINITKSKFFVNKNLEDLEILGFTLSKDRVIPQSKKLIQSINFQKPKTRKELQKFLGHVCFLRDVTPLIVSEFCSILSPLTSEKKEWIWGEKENFAFENVKELLNTIETTLTLPVGNGINIIYTDASAVAIGGIAFRVNFSEEFAIDMPENLLDFHEEWITKVNDNLELKVKSLHYLDTCVEKNGETGCRSLLRGLVNIDAARNPNSNIIPPIDLKALEQKLIDTVYSHLGLVQQLFESKESCDKFFNIINEDFLKGGNDT